jgi:hypothetical protein
MQIVAMAALVHGGSAWAADAGAPHWGYHGADTAEKRGGLNREFALLTMAGQWASPFVQLPRGESPVGLSGKFIDSFLHGGREN